MLTDTHSHIYAEEFDADRDEVIARAEGAGVGLILLPAIDSESYDRQEALAASRPDLFRQMMGLHPTSVGADNEEALQTVRQKLFANSQKYIGIGEIGLDFLVALLGTLDEELLTHATARLQRGTPVIDCVNDEIRDVSHPGRIDVTQLLLADDDVLHYRRFFFVTLTHCFLRLRTRSSLICFLV